MAIIYETPPYHENVVNGAIRDAEEQPNSVPLERPPANGIYTGRAKVRTLPFGVQGAGPDAQQKMSFGNGAPDSHKKQARRASVEARLRKKARARRASAGS